MMRCKSYLFTLLLFLCIWVQAQDKTLSGFITDQDGEAIALALISTIPSSKNSAQSNAYGFFTIAIPAEFDSILVHFIGYSNKIIDINAFDLLKDVQIILDPYTLDEVEVVAAASVENLNRVSIDLARIKTLPFLLGETDPMKAFLRFPGIQGGLEGSSSLHVRGGSPDQNLLLLDDAVIYNANHIFGFLSIFNGNVIKTADLFKGGFNAKYGGRLSSVIDVRTREGSRDTTRQKLGIGLISSDYVREGPIFAKRGSYLVSLRAATILPVTIVQRSLYVSGQTTDLVTYSMFDGNVKFNYDLNPSDKLYLSLYFSNDRLLGRYKEFTGDPDEDKSKFKWGNFSFSARYTHPFGKKTFFNGILYRTNYNFNLKFQSIEGGDANEFSNNFIQTNKIKEWGSRFSFTTQLNSNHAIQYGLDFSQYDNIPASQVSYVIENGTRDTVYQRNTASDGFNTAVYLHNKFSYGIFTFDAGLRGTFFHSQLTSSDHYAIEPRAGAMVELNNSLGLLFSYDKMYQFIQSLNSTGSGLPYETWVLSDKNIPPSVSHNYSAGLQYKSMNGKNTTNINYYYRRFKGLSELTGRGFFILPPDFDFEEFVASEGKGRAWGLEISNDFRWNKNRFEISYTYGKSWRWFTEIDNGESFPYSFDRRHVLVTSLDFNLIRNWKLNLTWEFQSGPPIDMPTSRSINQFGEISYIYGHRNEYRLPVYHRMDIALYHSKTKNHKTHEWSFGVYNVFSRQNPYYLRINKHIIEDENHNQIGLLPFVEQVSLFRFLPYVKYTMTF